MVRVKKTRIKYEKQKKVSQATDQIILDSLLEKPQRFGKLRKETEISKPVLFSHLQDLKDKGVVNTALVREENAIKYYIADAPETLQFLKDQLEDQEAQRLATEGSIRALEIAMSKNKLYKNPSGGAISPEELTQLKIQFRIKNKKADAKK